MSLAICVFSTMLNLNCLILECIAILVEFLQNLTCKAFFSTNYFNAVSNEAPVLNIPNVNDVACVNGSVALIECIEHEYA
jgi:hypothetical protein